MTLVVVSFCPTLRFLIFCVFDTLVVIIITNFSHRLEESNLNPIIYWLKKTKIIYWDNCWQLLLPVGQWEKLVIIVLPQPNRMDIRAQCGEGDTQLSSWCFGNASGLFREHFVIKFRIKRDTSQYVHVRTDSTCWTYCEYVPNELRVRSRRTLDNIGIGVGRSYPEWEIDEQCDFAPSL